MLALALAACAPAQTAALEQGRFVEWERIVPEGLPDQRVTIWLPEGYDTSERRYRVLYMHDGHNLFDLENSNFQKIWEADTAMLKLVRDEVIEPHIIVGIWAPGEDRYRQYLPQFVEEQARGDLAASMRENTMGRPVVSARYLEWIADELKPRIDTEYRTRSGAQDTAIMGSSMGGIMSCYAIAARPDVFGKAGCVSSHWPIALPAEAEREQATRIWTNWFAENLGEPKGRRIWMDHGTATLDAYYPPYQAAVDEAFEQAGWIRGQDFESRSYEGAEHDENAWADRLPEILTWLLSER
ncbi:hypothetical protein GRI94_08755 [Erythrobacter jejuensis]|uniref:Esterase n=1 Tax=Parerythrobacter jejuensis TaxID=795812 RepID=A0A845ASU1_9SPHN|nr:hypothetical protein [Parerythrobacter jejuensis]